MEPKRYRKNYWSRMLILIVIIIGVVSLYLYIKYDCSEKTMINSNISVTTAPCMITTNIAWHDSICKVVIDEIELVSVVDEADYIMKPYYKKIIKLSDKDTLIMDSLSYIQLRDYVVVPEYRIDSICKREGIKGLLSTYFDDIWFTPCYNENGALSLSEQRYVIYVLLQHGLSVRKDCESGDIYINRSATLKN